MTYTIATSDGLTWEDEYETQEEAIAAVAAVYHWDAPVVSTSYAEGDQRNAVSIYETAEERDADETGAFAPRVIDDWRTVSALTILMTTQTTEHKMISKGRLEAKINIMAGRRVEVGKASMGKAMRCRMLDTVLRIMANSYFARFGKSWEWNR